MLSTAPPRDRHGRRTLIQRVVDVERLDPPLAVRVEREHDLPEVVRRRLAPVAGHLEPEFDHPGPRRPRHIHRVQIPHTNRSHITDLMHLYREVAERLLVLPTAVEAL